MGMGMNVAAQNSRWSRNPGPQLEPQITGLEQCCIVLAVVLSSAFALSLLLLLVCVSNVISICSISIIISISIIH